MEEYASATSSLGNKDINSRREKEVKSEIKLGLPLVVPDLLYKSLIICLMGN
jgi:hypothetical protein